MQPKNQPTKTLLLHPTFYVHAEDAYLVLEGPGGVGVVSLNSQKHTNLQLSRAGKGCKGKQGQKANVGQGRRHSLSSKMPLAQRLTENLPSGAPSPTLDKDTFGSQGPKQPGEKGMLDPVLTFSLSPVKFHLVQSQNHFRPCCRFCFPALPSPRPQPGRLTVPCKL